MKSAPVPVVSCGDSSVSRTNFTLAAPAAGLIRFRRCASAVPKEPLRAVMKFTPSDEVSSLKPFVAEDGPSPQVLPGSSPNSLTATAALSSMTITGGPACGLSGSVDVDVGLNGDQPVPSD